MKLFHILNTIVVGDFTQFYRKRLDHSGRDGNIFSDQAGVFETNVPESMKLMMNLQVVYELRGIVNHLAGGPSGNRRRLQTRFATAFSTPNSKT